MSKAERWRDVAGFEGLYQVSDLGRIKSLSRYVGRKNGPRKTVERILRPLLTGRYPRVDLCRLGRRTCRTIHRLVLEAFVGPRPDGHEARHINGNKLDNRLENLRWGTAKENAADRTRHGTQARGVTHPCAKMTVADVVDINLAQLRGEKHRVIAKRIGVHPSTVSDIARSITWKHVTRLQPSPIRRLLERHEQR